MGFRFRRSLKIAPGVRLNLGKSGISTSIGGRGATYTIGPKANRTTVSLPGTGLSWTSATPRGGPLRPQGLTQGVGGTGTSGLAGCGWFVALLLLIGLIGMCSKDPVATSAVSPPAENESLFFVQPRSANCRAAATAGATVVTGLARAQRVAVTERSGDWSHVTAGGQTCWVSSALLGKDPPIAEDGSSLQSAGTDTASKASSALGMMSTGTRAASHSSRPRVKRSDPSFDAGCPCSGSQVCIGPRGGRYCITSGGNKRYGV